MKLKLQTRRLCLALAAAAVLAGGWPGGTGTGEY